MPSWSWSSTVAGHGNRWTTNFLHLPNQRARYAPKDDSIHAHLAPRPGDTLWSGSLALQIGPKPLEFELHHFDRDVFLYQPTGESASGPAGVRFSIDPSRRADRVLIENLNIRAQGSFSRVK
jgi:hypothetical protein